MTSIFYRHRHLIIYGAAMAILLFVLKWLELRLLIFKHAYEVYAGAIAVIFTVLGIWIATRLIEKKEKIVIEKVYHAPNFTFNEAEFESRKITRRELEVLQLMASGHSNNEIAEKLFVSTNTVKTHAARIFEKLEARRRTQAVETAKKLGLIA